MSVTPNSFNAADSRRRLTLKHGLAGGICLLTLALIFEQSSGQLPRQIQAIAAQLQPITARRCAQVVQSKAVLDRQTLGKLLTVPEGKSRSAIQAIVQQPYCKLPALNVRVGEKTEREAYPLAFKPDTWLVVTYEEDTYAGFDFLLQ